jgi:hypothetical protein
VRLRRDWMYVDDVLRHLATRQCWRSHHAWRANTTSSRRVWECIVIAFTPELDVEAVGEWLDCHIQFIDEYRAVTR